MKCKMAIHPSQPDVIYQQNHCGDAGIYTGTNTGQLFYGRDSGDSWDLLADYLPSTRSVGAAVVDW
jgi:hypothetical protein